MKLWKKVLIGIGAVLVVLAIAGAVVFAQLRARFAGPEISEVTAADSATVTTTAGTLRGGESDGVFIFKGVRYATAPRRFEPAQPVEPWEGVVDATEYGPTSPQGAILGMGASGNGDGTSNDCQTVNIWTPGLDDEARPIMVWLHGGGFSTGSGNDAQYDGEALARSGNVVVVAVNHRLNLYGHLDLSAYGNQYRYSGNVGVMDIQMALEWLRDNAASFGGDPDNITVFGQSGGGAKVIALASSPYAADLISKGIVQSGATETMGASFATAEQSARLTEHLLENLGISPDNVEALQTVSDADLQAAAATALQQTADEFQIPAPLTDGYQMEW
ncbi:MAG: carboxylesterase/lipase family protein, partial [Atopobiaceae bacterium]|nr:carboxylesterase/lipase family protein [Atopobiaceae bacterium]